MSHFVAYILQFQEIIVYKIPPGGGGGSIASLRSTKCLLQCSMRQIGKIVLCREFYAFKSSNWNDFILRKR